MKWAQSGLAALLVCLVVFAAGGIIFDNVAHAGDLKGEVINRVIVNIAKRIYGDPSMSDEELERRVNNEVDTAFRAYDAYTSDEERSERISSHCWRVYWQALHPGEFTAWAEVSVPGEVLDPWGNTYNEVELCVRLGYIPRPTIGGLDSE